MADVCWDPFAPGPPVQIEHTLYQRLALLRVLKERTLHEITDLEEVLKEKLGEARVYSDIFERIEARRSDSAMNSVYNWLVENNPFAGSVEKMAGMSNVQRAGPSNSS